MGGGGGVGRRWRDKISSVEPHKYYYAFGQYLCTCCCEHCHIMLEYSIM